MSLSNTDTRWGGLNKVMHWGIALVVILSISAVWYAGSLPKGDPGKGTWMMLHKSFGVTALALMVIWRIIRVKTGRPAPYGAIWQVRLAQVTHWGLILLVIAMPLAGILMSQVGGRDLVVFNLFTIPPVMAENKDLAGLIYTVHTKLAAPLLLFLIVAHVAGALWHHVFDKDETLKRMIH